MSDPGPRPPDGGEGDHASRRAYLAYGLAVGVASIGLLPLAAWMAVRGRGPELAERLGRLPDDAARVAGRGPVWIHAASVGEVRAAEPLVQLLRQTQPERPLLITTTSVAGRDTARGQLGVPASLLPIDCSALVSRVVRRLRPAVLVIMETELWPNLLRAAARQGVPVILASARLSATGSARYAWVRPVIRAALGQFSVIAAQTRADADRFIALGAPAERVEVVGSLKFARQPPADAPLSPVALGGRPVLVAASTQPGEEEVVLDACREVWSAHPDAILVLAPRRPERFDAVADLVAKRGVPFVRRSSGAFTIEAGVRLLLLDSLGELTGFLGAARAAFVGGTIAPVGGHNVLEPAVFAVPTAFGPHLENVREAAEALLEADGARVVSDAAGLAAFWSAMLGDAAMAKAMGERARAELERGAAAGRRTLALLEARIEAAR